MNNGQNLKLAFVVGSFPRVSETFIIDQIIQLQSAGLPRIKVFVFHKNSDANITEEFAKHNLADQVHYLQMPEGKLARLIFAVPCILRLLWRKPSAILGSFNVRSYKRDAWSLRLLYWVDFFSGVNEEFDLFHCHFGTTANKFLKVREILEIKTKFITTFYGYDVSRVFRQYGDDFYQRLRKECSLFFVMSENMKSRMISKGFDPAKIIVHPVGINPDKYLFTPRLLAVGQSINIVSVGRLVEKKGFDDLLRALAIVNQKTAKNWQCNIIGDGPLKTELLALTVSLGLEQKVNFKGYMKIEDIMTFFREQHFFVQPSKLARDGDME